MTKVQEIPTKSLETHIYNKMTNKTLSDKEMNGINLEGSRVYYHNDVKEKVQNAQRRLKELLIGGKFVNCEFLKERIDKIFKEEFGEKLI